MKERWFTAFERSLAESGWFDKPDREDLYEEAGKAAWDEILNWDALEEDDEHS